MTSFVVSVLASLVFGAVVFGSSRASAFTEPVRDVTLLNQPFEQDAVRVRTARLLYVNYALIRRDFPETAHMSNSEIDALILKYCGAIALSQTRPNGVNTPIDSSGETVKAARPRGYGRALVYKFLSGLMDGKGAGGLFPEQKGHSNGLASTTEALREVLMERLIHAVTQDAGYEPGTVESYAVVDWGFDVIGPDGAKEPAGMVLRQAHLRGAAVGRLPPDVAQKLERMLRKYGIVSDYSSLGYEYQTIDRQNVQAANNGSLFDFGAYRVLRWLFKLNSSPVQPDPAIRVPADHWAAEETAPGVAPYNDEISVTVEKIVIAWKEGQISREQVDGYVEKLLHPALQRFAAHSCSVLFEL